MNKFFTVKIKRNSLAQGFVNGLCSPVTMYDSVDFPSVPAVAEVEAPSHSDKKAISRDWNAVASDLKLAISQYSNSKFEKVNG